MCTAAVKLALLAVPTHLCFLTGREHAMSWLRRQLDVCKVFTNPICKELGVCRVYQLPICKELGQPYLLLRLLLNLCCVAQADVKIMSLPSKRQGLYTVTGSTIIARSDSNGEDLEAFAGAGNLLSV